MQIPGREAAGHIGSPGGGRGHRTPSLPCLVPVPNSHGGRGERVKPTWTLPSPTPGLTHPRRVRPPLRPQKAMCEAYVLLPSLLPEASAQVAGYVPSVDVRIL